MENKKTTINQPLVISSGIRSDELLPENQISGLIYLDTENNELRICDKNLTFRTINWS